MLRALAASALLSLLALRAEARIGEHSLGLNTHVPSNDLLDLCAALGVGWIRVDGNWLEMNPAAGRYDYATMDRVVDEAARRNIKVYLSLGYTPAWVPREPRMRTDTYGGNDEPQTSAEWVTFVEDAAAHFRMRGVTHVGIWNEPNLDSFWETAAGVDRYVDKILLPGVAAVRRRCADCVVLGPELAHVGAYDTFLDRVLTRAPAGTFDILSHHIYQGWPETGVQVWDGDNFLNALEMRRFTFTRAGLREVLMRHGWNGEVWITETGYRAAPGDAAAEMRQATFVRRVMEEELARPWWTNSFFYEVTDCGVDQPSCPIDGFGITRPLRTGARAFPADYRQKPAYDAIRAFITAHPEIVSRAPPPQCGDGVDNDNDGRVDAEDRGCENGTDANEADDPPRITLEAEALAPGAPIAVDGDLSEWSASGRLPLTRWVGEVPYGGAQDVAAAVRARWTAGVLFLAVEVEDDVLVNDRADDALWQADSVQLAFDVARNYGDRYDATDDHELNFALVAGQARSFRFLGPQGATSDFGAAVRRTGTVTAYEIRIAAAALAPAQLAAGARLGFSMLVNDNDGRPTTDGTGREGWLEMTPGIGASKRPYLFGELALRAPGPLPDAGPRDAAPAPDAAAPADAAVANADAGVATPDAGAPARDAGMAPADASTSDAGTVARDAATSAADAGRVDAAPVSPPTTEGGCSCNGASTMGSGSRALLGLLLLAAAWRRARSLRGDRGAR